MGLDFSKLRGPECGGDATDAYKQMLNSVGVRYHGVDGAHGAHGAHGGGVFGGGDSDESDESKDKGVLRELRNYESSLAAKTKEESIRRIAHAMKRAGIEVNPEGDLDEVVAELQRRLPNPKNGKTFASSAPAQEKVCRVIADVMNDEFSPGVSDPARKFIDTSLNAVEVCRAVAERAHSFSHGVNVEFLAVHASIKHAMRNLQLLDGILDGAYKNIADRIAETGDSRQTADLENFQDLFARARAEQKRALGVLQNILNVELPPSAKMLEIALQEQSDLNATIKKLRLSPGTSKFGDSLASAISGLGTAAAVAARAHRALKTVGLTVREFAESPSFKEFQQKLEDRMYDTKVPKKDLGAFLKAAEELRLLFADRETPRFREQLEELGSRADNVGVEGAGEDVSGDESGGESEDESKNGAGEIVGGAPNTEYERMRKKQESAGKIIIKDFALRLARHYDEFLAAVKGLGAHLGKEIPLTDHTDKLRNAIAAVQTKSKTSASVDSQRIELALIGRYVDAEARKLKDQFVGRMRLIANACDELLALEMYRPAAARFSRVHDAVKSIEKTIDYYAGVFAQSLDRGTGEASDLKLLLPEIAKSAYSLQEAVNEFVYLYYVARVRVNLAKTARELESYGDGYTVGGKRYSYTELLEDAVKNKLSQLEYEQYIHKGRLDALVVVPQVQLRPQYPAAPAPQPNPPVPPIARLQSHPKLNITSEVKKTDAKTIIDTEYKVKTQFYRALQALDLYMKEFTVAIAKDPDAVGDIKKIFDGTQVIARWFSEETGDSICRAFEQCGSVNWDGAGADDTDMRVNVKLQTKLPNTTNLRHYYELVGDEFKGIDDVDVGVPGTPINDYKKASESVKKAYENFQALKNLINAFARIGDKFGGQALHTKVFMSPAQIYKALLDYLKQSAISINRTKAGARVNTAATTDAINTFAHETTTAEDVAPSFVKVPELHTMLGTTSNHDKFGAGPYQTFFSSTFGFDNYKKEREMFATAIKAMAAKVLTVIGVYDMFERTAPLYQLTPVRMIVGGADGGAATEVAIEPAATELYYRLPLLAEFYKKLLDYDKTRPSGKPPGGGLVDPQIALLADFEGVFAGLIQFIFVKAQSAEYSDEELRTLVREVNAIHAHYAQTHPEGTTAAALAGFVAEINRRYGLIKEEDYKSFQDSVNRVKTLRPIETGDMETNYAILPGEEDLIDSPAPNVYFPKGWEKPEAVESFDGRPDLRKHKWALLEFRKRLDKEFETTKGKFLDASATEKLAQARAELARAPTPMARMAVVSSLIRGDATNVDTSVAFMFHETVVVGLNTLSAIKTMLDQFSHELSFMDPCKIEGAIMDAFYRKNARNLNPAGAVAPLPDITSHVTLVAVMDAMRAIGKGAFANIGDNPDESTKLPIGAFGSDLLMRNYMISAAGTLGMRSGLPAGIRAVDGDGVCTNATTANGNHQLAAATINQHGPQNWTKQPSTYTDTYVNGAFTYFGGIGAVPNGNITDQTMKALKVVARLLVNYPEIMYRFLESLFAISADGLVDVSITKTGIRIDFAKLQTMVEELFADVKYYFELLRPNLSRSTVEKYMAEVHQGSIEWVDKNLIDKYFRSTDIAGKPAPDSIQGITSEVSNVFKNLTRNTGVNFSTVALAANIQAAAANAFVDKDNIMTAVGPAAATAVAKSSAFEWYGSTFARIGWYDATVADSGVIPLDDAGVAIGAAHGAAAAAGGLDDGTDEFNGLVATARRAGVGGAAGAVQAAPHPRIGGVANSTSIIPLYKSADKTIHLGANSIMFNYNRLVARYLLTLLDTAAGNKIYLNLVNAFVNGVASASVSDPGSFAHPDIVTAIGAAGAAGAGGTGFIQRGDPKPNAVLLASIAWVLQRIRNDSSPTTNIADHLVTTLTDVPLYIKEAMRANLPSFVRLFDLIAKKCDFIKQVMQKTEAKTHRPNLQTIAGANADALMYGAIAGAAAAGDIIADSLLFPGGLKATCIEKLNFDGATDVGVRALRTRYAAIFDALASGALTLSSAASETLKELGDSAVYLQTGEGAIEQYTMRFGKAPLMPLSLALYMLRNNVGVDSPIELAFPRHSLGTPSFKLMYGLRAIVAPSGSAALSYDQLPGVQTALALYNGAHATRSKSIVDPARYLQFANMTAGAIRWITDTRCYKGLLSAERTIRETVLVKPVQAGAALTVAELDEVARTAAGVAAAAANPLGNATRDAIVRQYEYSKEGIVSTATIPRFAAYSLGDAAIEGTISIIESSDQESSLSDIAEAVVAAAGGSLGPDERRKSARIQNLIDMNIIPINVHAMMRGVPLANLYNYEYTFEQLACQMLGERTACLDVIGHPQAQNATQEFLRLLKDPYKEIGPVEYGSDCTNAGSDGFIHRIFRGDNGLGMGRPKFLSDQIFNKPLFGSVYQSRQDWDEAGPITGIGKSRGYAGVIRGGVGRLLREIQREMEMDFYNYMNLSGFYGAARVVLDIATVMGAPTPDHIFGAAPLVLQQHGIAPARIRGTLVEKKAAMDAVAADGVAQADTARYFGDAAYIAVQAVLNRADEAFLAEYVSQVVAADAATQTALEAVNAQAPAGGADALLIAVIDAAVAVTHAAPAGVAGAGIAAGNPGAGANPARLAYAGETLTRKGFMDAVARAFATAAVAHARALIAAGAAGAGAAAAAVAVGVTAPLTLADTLCPTLGFDLAAAAFVAASLLRNCVQMVGAAAANGALAIALAANVQGAALAAYNAAGAAAAAPAFAENARDTVRDAVIEALRRSVIVFMGNKQLFGGADAAGIIDKYIRWRTDMYRMVTALPASASGATPAQERINKLGATQVATAFGMPTADDANTTALQNALIAGAGQYRDLGAGAGAVAIANGTNAVPYGAEIDANTIAANKYTPLFYIINALDTLEYYTTKNIGTYCLAALAGLDVTTESDDVMLAYRYLGVSIWQSNARAAGAGGAAALHGEPAIGAAVVVAQPAALSWWAVKCDAAVGPRNHTSVAARAGTASLTWLGAEVPAEDDTHNPAATHEFEAIHKVKLHNPTTKQRLESVGLARFNTHFIRDLFFIANVVRLVRLKLNRELTHSRGVLRASHMAVAPDVTEYGMDPFGANSVFESNTRATYDKDSEGVIGNPRWDDGPFDDGGYSRKKF